MHEGPHLGEVSVFVADPIGAVILGDFPEQQFRFWGIACAGDTGGGIDDDGGLRTQVTTLQERQERQEDGGRVAAPDNTERFTSVNP
jgi:hypothetical protein